MGSTFVSYVRPGAHALTGDGAVTGARREGTVTLQLAPMDGGAARTAALEFELLGPGDVTGLRPEALTRRHPPPGTVDAVPELAAHVEFSDADLPWRYSPDAPAGGALRPWLALLVGLDGDEVSLVGRSRVVVAPAVLAACDLAKSALMAHAHVAESGARQSRLLSPCVLEQRRLYRAALVPAFRVDDAGGGIVDAWSGTPAAALELPLYDTWTFATDENDDFPILAGRLKMMTASQVGEGFGTTRVRLAEQPPSASFSMLGALVRPGTSDADGAAPSVRSWSQLVEAAGRWVLGPPQYDEPWRTTPVATAGWPTELLDDPRRRLAAGLGAFCAIDRQDQLAEGTRLQAGALELAAHALRLLGLGLAAGKSLFARRLPPAVDGVGRLAALGPLLARLPSNEGGTADRALRDRTPRLHPSLLSGALRRLIRPGSSIAVQAAAPPTVAGLLEAANRCPPRERPGVFTALLREDAPQASEARVDESIARWPQLGPHRRRLLANAPALAAGSRAAAARGERPPCTPVDLSRLGNLIADAIDPGQPHPPARRRVLARFPGLGVPPAPVFEPELDLPLANVLKDLAPQWLLPGRGKLPADRIVPLAANGRFTDAALVGANQRALGELRWRNVRVRSGWSPLRHFWPHPEAPDVVPLRAWGATPLGAPAHRPPGVPPDLLVVVIRSALLRRFPATAIYLLDPGVDPARLTVPEGPVLPGQPKPVPEGQRLLPIFRGAIEPDLHYVGFALTPADAKDRHLVFEEPPAKPRFRTKGPFLDPARLPSAATDGAAYARAAFHARTVAFMPMPDDPSA